MAGSNRNLDGKVAIVTGGARGMGRGIALELARAGADVAIADIDLDGARTWGEELSAASVMDEIRALGRRSTGFQGDLGAEATTRKMVDQVVTELGGVDILVNVAGGAITEAAGSFASISPESDLDLLMAANYKSTVFCCQAATPYLKARRGAIVNFSSTAGTHPNATGALAHYGASKAAINSFTRSLAGELGPFGVRVNALLPGLILTARVATLAEKRGIATANEIDRIPLRRLGQVEDLTKVVEFLVSEDAGYITGQCIAVNGGLTRSAT